MEKLNKYITLLDYFGYPLTFKHNQQITYRTTLGGSLTLLTLIFLVYSFLIFSKDCFNKTNPSVRETNTYDDYTVVDGKKIFFSFYFTDDKFRKIENPEKYLIFHGVITNYTDDISTRTVPFVKCDIDRHFKNKGLSTDKLQNKLSNLNYTYCLDIEEDFNLINSGTEIPRLSLSVFVIECTNQTIHDVDRNFYFLFYNFSIIKGYDNFFS